MPGRFSTPLASILSDHPGALNGHVAPSASSTNFSLPYNSPSTSVPLAGTFPRSPTTSRHSGGGSSSSSRKQRHARVAKTLRDLNGTWTLVPSLSTGSAPREGEDSATLWISHSNYPSSIFVKETTGREERVTRQTQRYFPPQSRGVWSCWWDGKRRSRWVVGRELEDRGGSGVLTSGLGKFRLVQC